MLQRTFKISGLVGAFVVSSALAVSAATVALIDSSTQGAGNDADVYAAGYGGITPAGAAWSVNPLVTPPPINDPGIYQSPFNNTAAEAGGANLTFFSVGATAAGNGAASPATLTFASAVSSFRLLWGSIDSYNTLTFNLTGGGSESYTGTDIVTMFTLGGTASNFEQVALLDFSGFLDRSGAAVAISSVTFVSSSAAFEFALSPVPLPAAGLLLLGALGGLGAIGRRRRRS